MKEDRGYYKYIAIAILFISIIDLTSALNVNSCPYITTSNQVINVTADMTSNALQCFIIESTAGNLTIEGNGHKITGKNNATTVYGVYFSNGGTNTTINNLVLEGFDYPVYTGTYSAIVANNMTLENTIGRIFKSGVVWRGVDIENITFSGYTAVTGASNFDNVIINNSVFNNTYLLYFNNFNNFSLSNSTRILGSNYIEFRNNTYVLVTNNTDLDMIRITNSTGIIFSNNLYNSASKVIIENSGSSISNLTIKDNLVLGSTPASSAYPYLFNLQSLDNSEIKNNIFGSESSYLYFNLSSNAVFSIITANNLTFSNNSMYVNSSTGLYLKGSTSLNSSNILIDSNNVNLKSDDNSYGITCGNDDITCTQDNITYISNCTIKNNYVIAPISTIGRHMVMLKCAKNSNVYNNTVIGGGYNFVIKDDNNVNIFNNWVVNGSFGNIHVKGTSNSFFYNNIFGNKSVGQLFYIWNDNNGPVPSLNNTFLDMDLRNSNNCPQINIGANASTSQKFINISISNSSCLLVGNGTTNGINNASFYWYYYFISNQQATNLTVYDVNSNLIYQINNSKNSNTILKEFEVIDGTYTYQGNYTISAKHGTQTINHSYNLSSTKNILEDSFTFPILTTLVSPQNRPYNNRTQLLNISSDGEGVWYNWNGTNVTYTSPLIVIFAEGSNTLIVYANDSNGDINSTNTTFYIDAVAPNIGLVYPEEGYSETIESTTINFQFNVSDASEIDNCTLYLNGIAHPNSSSINKSLTNSILVSSVSPGSYSWYINCTDALGNQDNSSINTFIINAPPSSGR